MATKRKLSAISADSEQAVDPSDELMFLCLGGGNEVGRSCHIIQYKGKTVMVCSCLPTEILSFTNAYLLHSSTLASTLLSTVLPLCLTSTSSISAQWMYYL